MKLIKLSEDHYIVVDDSKYIVDGDWVLFNNEVLQTDYFDSHFNKWEFKNKSVSPVEYQRYDKPKKITHSTQPIERWFQNIDFSIRKGFGKIQQLSLLEVKELFSEDTDVWSRKLEYLKKVNENIKHKSQDERIWIFGASDLGFTAGYNQALEDNKEKKYTEEDITEAILRTIDACNEAQKDSYGELEIDEEAIIQSLQPQTEWEVEFNEHGKLTLV